MPTDRAFVEMTTVGRPLDPTGSSNTAGYQDDDSCLRIKIAGACHRCVHIFSYRLVQVVIVSIYLALLIHAVLNKGWWLYVNVPLGLGCRCSISLGLRHSINVMAVTACVVAYFAIAFTALRNFGHNEGGVFNWKIACLIDAMLFVLWGITFIASKWSIFGSRSFFC